MSEKLIYTETVGAHTDLACEHFFFANKENYQVRVRVYRIGDEEEQLKVARARIAQLEEKLESIADEVDEFSAHDRSYHD